MIAQNLTEIAISELNENVPLGRDGVRHPVRNMETLTLSRNERKRMTIMAGVKRQELTQVQAAELMNLGYRQTKRGWRRYQDQGDAGLVHRLRGQAGWRRKPAAVRTQVLALYAEEHYADFGPTLLAEELGKVGIVVDHDTVRRRKQQHRQWRERKPCFGAKQREVQHKRNGMKNGNCHSKKDNLLAPARRAFRWVAHRPRVKNTNLGLPFV